MPCAETAAFRARSSYPVRFFPASAAKHRVMDAFWTTDSTTVVVVLEAASRDIAAERIIITCGKLSQSVYCVPAVFICSSLCTCSNINSSSSMRRFKHTVSYSCSTIVMLSRMAHADIHYGEFHGTKRSCDLNGDVKSQARPGTEGAIYRIVPVPVPRARCDLQQTQPPWRVMLFVIAAILSIISLCCFHCCYTIILHQPQPNKACLQPHLDEWPPTIAMIRWESCFRLQRLERRGNNGCIYTDRATVAFNVSNRCIFRFQHILPQ